MIPLLFHPSRNTRGFRDTSGARETTAQLEVIVARRVSRFAIWRLLTGGMHDVESDLPWHSGAGFLATRTTNGQSNGRGN